MKRLFDIMVVVLLIPFIVLLIFLVAIPVRINFGQSVFFRQTRIGLDNKPFTLIKFRSMFDTRDEKGKLLSDDKRLSRFGNFLRSSSLDEIPSLFNVLKGELSLVGPRPLLPEYLPLYNDYQKRRHKVRPGVTGWAQVNGRNNISWEEKFNLDIWYVENQSLWLDMRILWITIKKVFIREGISADGFATMPKFTGKKK